LEIGVFFNVGETLGTKQARMVIPVVSREFPSFRALPRPIRALTHHQAELKQKTHYLSQPAIGVTNREPGKEQGRTLPWGFDGCHQIRVGSP
jgi:hypothetical protein